MEKYLRKPSNKNFSENKGVVLKAYSVSVTEKGLFLPYSTSVVTLNSINGLKIRRINKFKGMSKTVREIEPEYIPGYKIRG